MADDKDIDVSKPAEPPKPVRIGGESIADRILPHIKKIIVAVIGIAVVASIYFGWRAYKQSQQAEATARLAAVLGVAQRPVVPPGGTAEPGKNFASPKERASAVLDEMAKRDTEAAGHAYRGGLLLDAGKIEDAIAEYRKGTTKDGIEAVLSHEGLGIALEEKARAEKDPAARQRTLEEALVTFAKMQTDAKGPRYHYALYHQGRVLQTLGKVAEAKTKFTEAKNEAAPDLGVLVEQRLASLGES